MLLVDCVFVFFAFFVHEVCSVELFTTTVNPLVTQQYQQLGGLLGMGIFVQLVVLAVILWLILIEWRTNRQNAKLQSTIEKLRSDVDEAQSNYFLILEEKNIYASRNDEYEELKKDYQARCQEIVDEVKEEIEKLRKEGKVEAVGTNQLPYFEQEYADLKRRAAIERAQALRMMNETIDGVRKLRQKQKEQNKQLEHQRALIGQQSKAERKDRYKRVFASRPKDEESLFTNLYLDSSILRRPRLPSEVKDEKSPFDDQQITEVAPKDSTQIRKKQHDSSTKAGLNIKDKGEYR
ncbi:hypothetical protein M3Y96_01163000 [Aphelenchoides besseyi]|nr:hypothetical protein M3Y96_01163000 [Aphelenchoides besseyi]